MNDREPVIATAAVFILFLIWIAGDPSQDFAGSALGGFLAVTGALLLSVPLLYSAVKRIDLIKTIMVRHAPIRTILSWHIYTGFLGTILVLLHTGHKFNSVLAVSLTALTLAVVFSGVIGRYIQRQIGDDIRGKRKLLSHLYEEYDSISALNTLATIPALSATADTPTNSNRPRVVVGVVNLVSSIADVESAITTRETLKQWFTVWNRVHITLVIGMYLLLVLHVWSGIHFGLRWLP